MTMDQIPGRPMSLEPGDAGRADIFTRLLKNRVVMLGTDVNDDIANQICAQLLYLEGEDPDADIWLYINSPGGSVTAGMAIYDTMQFVSCDVATVCMGLAASMGQFLLTAGANGKRYTLPNARIMMHQPLAGLRGQATDISIQVEQLGYTKKRMAELTAFHSGQSLERTRDECVAADQQLHLEVFMRHLVGQEPYETLAPALGLSATQCSGMTRTVASKFRRALAGILIREGADPADLDREIERLMGDLGE